MSTSLGLVGGLVVLSMVIGAVDLLRQPTWAWRAAGEPKIICLLLVLLLPGVGVAIYVFGARPKVVEIAGHGRAASLPFETFSDRAEAGVDSSRAIQALSLPTTRGSFGEPIARPIRATAAPIGAAAVAVATPGTGVNFFDDPDVITFGADAGTIGQGAAAPAPVAVEAVDGPSSPPDLHIPGQVGKPYNPRQRASLDEGPLRVPSAAAMAAEVGAATYGGGGNSGGLQPVPQTVGATYGSAGLSAVPAPRVGTSTPEIFRPRPESVAPIAGTAPIATSPQATMAARWMNDPTGRHQYRYWDGGNWTENVYDAGVESRDAALG